MHANKTSFGQMSKQINQKKRYLNQPKLKRKKRELYGVIWIKYFKKEQVKKKTKKSKRAVVPAVSLNSLNLPQPNPHPECNHVTRYHGGSEERRDPEDQNLRPMRIRRRKTDRRSVLVMNLVNFLITPLTVEKSMDPIVCVVFN